MQNTSAADTNEKSPEILGRKVFFLNPPILIKEEIIPRLSESEYEVYSETNPEKMLAYLRKYPHSLCFINIEAGMTAEAWKTFVHNCRSSAMYRGTKFGFVINSISLPQIKQVFDEFKPDCGVIPIRADVKACLEILVKTLESENCRGRRKYVRAYCESDTMAVFNFTFDGHTYTMQIRDISSVGFAAYSLKNSDPPIAVNSVIPQAQLTLRGTRIMCEAVIYAVKSDSPLRTYVFLYTKKLEMEARNKIRAYINANLQSRLEEEM